MLRVVCFVLSTYVAKSSRFVDRTVLGGALANAWMAVQIESI